jgi:hypothetical protein
VVATSSPTKLLDMSRKAAAAAVVKHLGSETIGWEVNARHRQHSLRVSLVE